MLHDSAPSASRPAAPASGSAGPATATSRASLRLSSDAQALVAAYTTLRNHGKRAAYGRDVADWEARECAAASSPKIKTPHRAIIHGLTAGTGAILNMLRFWRDEVGLPAPLAGRLARRAEAEGGAWGDASALRRALRGARVRLRR